MGAPRPGKPAGSQQKPSVAKSTPQSVPIAQPVAAGRQAPSAPLGRAASQSTPPAKPQPAVQAQPALTRSEPASQTQPAPPGPAPRSLTKFCQPLLDRSNRKIVLGAAGALLFLLLLTILVWPSGKRGQSMAKTDPSSARNEEPVDSALSAEDLEAKAAAERKEATQNFLKAGGSEESEKAVTLGLQWLASQQWPEGCWSLNEKPEAGKTPNPGHNLVAATAFALLPFLARGETHKAKVDTGASEYTKPVERGIQYLVLQQKPDGSLYGSAAGQPQMYTHAVATIALCEALNMTSDPALRDPCQRAIDYIVKAQEPITGGWRYVPGMIGDTSVVSWQIQALKSGQMAGLHVPRETWEKAVKYLDFVSLPSGGYEYQRGSGGAAQPIPATMTACGMLCRQYVHGGENLRAPEMTKGADILMASPPAPATRNIYYYYYATQVLFNIGDQRWEKWNPEMRKLLIDSQIKANDSPLKGSWENQFPHVPTTYGGQLLTTSLSLLTLEVYYRHLPLNRPDLGNVTKRLEGKK